MTAAPPAPVPPAGRDLLAFLPRQDRHVPKCGPVRPSKVSRKRAWFLIGIHVLIGAHIWHWLATGNTLTPVEPSEAMQTVELGKINAGFLLFLALIASTLVFGRFFCGWACHVVALQDLSAWLLGKAGLKPRPVRSRLLVLAPWVVAGHMFAWPVVEHLLWPKEKPLPAPAEWEYHLTTENLWQTFPGPIMTVLTVLVAGGLIVWWLGAKGFCTHGCPYGAFFAIADRFAPVRIKVTDACDACGHCTSVCTSNVRVHEEVAKHGQLVDPGCMKCLDCISVCPKDALYVGFAWPKPFAKSQQRIQARADFTWFEEGLLAVVAFTAVQWTFRGAWFGEGIPLLLAVGLGVTTAVLALLLLRMLTHRDMTFQHTVLRRGGAFTGAGKVGLVALVAWLAFTAMLFTGNRLKGALSDRMVSLTRPDVATAELESTLALGDTAQTFFVVDDPVVGQLRGLLLFRLKREAEAEQALMACYEARGHMDYVEASICLAGMCMKPERQRFDVADKLINNVLSSQPQHPVAVRMRAYLDSRPK